MDCLIFFIWDHMMYAHMYISCCDLDQICSLAKHSVNLQQNLKLYIYTSWI